LHAAAVIRDRRVAPSFNVAQILVFKFDTILSKNFCKKNSGQNSRLKIL